MKLKSILKKSIAIAAIASLAVTSVYAGTTTEKKVLDIENAVIMAIGKDDTLAQMTRNIEVYQEQKKDLSNTVGIGNLNYNLVAIGAEATQQQKEQEKARIRFSVISSYQNQILLAKNIELLGNSIQLQEKVVKQMEIRYDKGFIDALTLEKSRQDLDELKTNKEKAEKQLKDLQDSFLTLTNVNVKNYTLVPDTTYEPINLGKSIESYATLKADELVKYVKQSAQTQSDNIWDNLATAGQGGTAPTYTTYLGQKNEAKTKLENAEAAYKASQQIIKNTYTKLVALESDIRLKEQALETAQKDFKIVEIKYKAGYVSKSEYDATELKIKQAEVDYLTTVYNCKTYKMQVEEPSLLTGSGNSANN